MEKRWSIKDEVDEDLILQLSQAINVDEILAKLLIQRKVTNFDDAKTYFRPALDHLHDPFIMKDMDKAVKRLLSAIRNGEKIMIYGDYDVDGTTSVALVYSFLRHYYQNLEFYIPDRYKEGYGISMEGIEFAHDAGCHLIISLDCGVKAVTKIAQAKKMGIDFIVCDHHTPGSELPVAAACLDPKREDCEYPEKELSGCGVGFKFMQAFCRTMNYPEEELYNYLDLVAVSIASDIVPITGENRVLAAFGLEKLNRDPRTGLKSIIQIANMEHREFLISDIVFKIGPRINAAGRIESGRDAVELLISEDKSLAEKMSQDINVCNETRKDLDRLTTQEALDLIDASEEMKAQKATVLFKPDWHKGVIGIVASRLTDSYYRPTVILTQSQGMATGSARSVDGFDLYKAIESCSDLLVNFGGHMYAAGLTMQIEKIPEFTRRFNKYVEENILPEQLIPQIEIDADIMLRDITPKFFRILKQFTPYGPGNMKPVFITRRVVDYGTSKLVGKDRDHVKLELIEEGSATIMQGIGFGMGKYIKQIKSGDYFDICYTIEENVFNGNTSIQLMIKDMRFPYSV
ncbi:single-stranded-DNA-specific exonuclease RecJ [Alkalitalea saponilacus]|uniref:Single-stranded-DNA-specific exonuclease RecJ n=1 Tax=Alkalitalea saponilacus TaxID=889453 RepID=A0A1T5A3E6_9BACT|nr:single-stranded-DNA-specific exonuclease RecJ [Alkalitalea saponilacus]ASB48886.1 single-stranded-DNA-specific exonuclease RecJ [Alkalitalea saponilacus]SKB29257.1 single-stranded-DNA-specific exonuclease [Alkalitalea saponilacus]